jgi:hypothetical protein
MMSDRKPDIPFSQEPVSEIGFGQRDFSFVKTKIFKANCADCDRDFECKAGLINTIFRPESKFQWIPKCPFCGNTKNNRLYADNGQLTPPIN